MSDKNTDTLGVVLAGGRSARMGSNKALLECSEEGKTLLDHMIDTLQDAGTGQVIVSGEYEGYECISDPAPYPGPAEAIVNIMREMPGYGGYLFAPVDMPYLQPGDLQALIRPDLSGAYYENCRLPLFIRHPDTLPDMRDKAVMALIEELEITPIPVPPEIGGNLANINTPHEWRDYLAHTANALTTRPGKAGKS